MVFFLTLILICQLIGESMVSALHLPVPGPVLGMAILFVGLIMRGEIPNELGKVADGLISHLSLLFIPAGVGVLLHVQLLGEELLPISAALFVSTFAAIAVTGLLMNWLSSKKGEADND